MAWKPKDKQLTEEEAINLAKVELSKYWHGTSPLLSAVPDEFGSASIFPLDKTFFDHTWIIFFINPTDFSGETTLHYAREIYRRYQSKKVNLLLVIRPQYPFYLERPIVENFLRKMQIPFYAVVDVDNLLAKSFKISEYPTVIYHDGKQIVYRGDGITWIENGELILQKYLRQTDPGLPLLNPFSPGSVCHKDVYTMEFGYGKGVTFPSPGFHEEGGFLKADFPAFTRQDMMAVGALQISGKWIQDEHKIITHDPNAVMAFRTPTSYFSVVAQCPIIVTDPMKISIESNNKPVPDLFGGEDFRYDDNGLSYISIFGPRLYYGLIKLPGKERQLTLRFPSADTAPVCLYGFRFSEIFS
ncbi:hypothetical protein K2X30_02465 [bacterium]|jgi:hypothetical protein|nr:hypothetical protein [bacterium]